MIPFEPLKVVRQCKDYNPHITDEENEALSGKVLTWSVSSRCQFSGLSSCLQCVKNMTSAEGGDQKSFIFVSQISSSMAGHKVGVQ